ncbi:MAG: hypothetical protein HY744_31155, partial [Deltaproteobacteria bacterium]|nr:hypothetical protein [Deltaproteobacteria bacterium]
MTSSVSLAGRLLAASGALCLVALAATARAQPDERRRAEELFEAAKQLAAEGERAEACESFAATVRAYPSVGARLNLARCHEQAGRTASAWSEYNRAAAMARAAGQAEREEGAQELAAKLEPKLSKLTVQPAAAAAGQAGLRLTKANPVGPEA